MEKSLFIISSPSGGGKTTICRRLLLDETSPIFGKCEFSISATTREPRGNEVNGVDYFFLSKQEFGKRLEDGEFMEHAKVFDSHYGTLKRQLSKTNHTLFDIDVQGHNQIKEHTEVLSIFLLPPSIEVLNSRIMQRGDLTNEQIERRIKKAPAEIEEAYKYDFILINEDLEKTFNAVCAIISSYLLKKHHAKLINERNFLNLIKTI